MSWAGELENFLYKASSKGCKKIAKAGLKEKAQSLIEILQENPYQNPPAFEKLIGNLDGAYSRRINFQHRLVYQISKEKKYVKVIRMWTHYE